MAIEKRRPKRLSSVFEARYGRGYKYLDRCGEALLILEDVLPQQTGRLWMTGDIAPKGATLKCPALDLTVVFDAHKLVVEQSLAEPAYDLDILAKTIVGVLRARFDIGPFDRLGNRVILVFPADAVEEAEAMSTGRSPSAEFPHTPDGLKPCSSTVTNVFESEDHTKGVRFHMAPSHRIEAKLELDPRLASHPRQQHHDQREALLERV